MSITTGAGVSTTQADLLMVALSKTGKFLTTPLEHGLAVRVETIQRNAKGSAPRATTKVWLPDKDDYRIGYAWMTLVDHELTAGAGLDQVVAAIIATLLPEEEL